MQELIHVFHFQTTNTFVENKLKVLTLPVRIFNLANSFLQLSSLAFAFLLSLFSLGSMNAFPKGILDFAPILLGLIFGFPRQSESLHLIDEVQDQEHQRFHRFNGIVNRFLLFQSRNVERKNENLPTFGKFGGSLIIRGFGTGILITEMDRIYGIREFVELNGIKIEILN